MRPVAPERAARRPEAHPQRRGLRLPGTTGQRTKGRDASTERARQGAESRRFAETSARPAQAHAVRLERRGGCGDDPRDAATGSQKRCRSPGPTLGGMLFLGIHGGPAGIAIVVVLGVRRLMRHGRGGGRGPRGPFGLWLRRRTEPARPHLHEPVAPRRSTRDHAGERRATSGRAVTRPPRPGRRPSIGESRMVTGGRRIAFRPSNQVCVV